MRGEQDRNQSCGDEREVRKRMGWRQQRLMVTGSDNKRLGEGGGQEEAGWHRHHAVSQDDREGLGWGGSRGSSQSSLRCHPPLPNRCAVLKSEKEVMATDRNLGIFKEY